MKKIWNLSNKSVWLKCVLSFLLGVNITVMVNVLVRDYTTPPVEEIAPSRLDSLTIISDSIKKQINNIDSITNENIKKSDSLNDDDAVRLLDWLLHSK